jgi:hypothetical protein
MTECTYHPDSIVDLLRWDRTVPPGRQLGLCRVTGVVESCSHSGYTVSVQSITYPGRRYTGLDTGWLAPADSDTVVTS